MRVFVTGATGFIGTAVVRELIGAGHQVLGLCRSADKAPALAAAGADIQHGSLEDLDTLRAAADGCDGVIHLAFNHDFSRYVANCEDDRRVIATLGETLAGSRRPLLVTSGAGLSTHQPGQPATEDDAPLDSASTPRAASEEAAADALAAGAHVAVVRLPQVHDTVRQGLVSYCIAIAREKGAYAYVGDGSNRWPAAHVLDVARLYRLALETSTPGARYHAVAEEGVSMRAMAEVIGPRLGLPVRSLSADEAAAHFGWMAAFAAADVPVSSAQTRQQLGWQPRGPGILDDLAQLQTAAA